MTKHGSTEQYSSNLYWKRNPSNKMHYLGFQKINKIEKSIQEELGFEVDHLDEKRIYNVDGSNILFQDNSSKNTWTMRLRARDQNSIKTLKKLLDIK